MQKKKLIIAVTASTLSLGVAAFALAQGYDAEVRKGYASGEQFKITLNNKGAVEEQEDGFYHQINVRNNKFDLLGWSDNGGSFGSIRKATHGVDNIEYNGMIYNRSAINGLESLKVTFTGSSLHYVFTDFLMENMDFNGPALTSGEAVAVPNDKAYFVVYNTSETAANIDSLEISYRCDGVIDNQMLYNKNSPMGYARSRAKTTTLEDSFVTLENDPNQHNNNYSTGKHDGHTNNDSWYRWNGRFLRESEELGTEFTFGMTVVGEYSMMTNASKNFNYSVWPQFSYEKTEFDEEKQEDVTTRAEEYVMTYIGNDNYEPLGREHALRPTDPYVNESYAGRYFGDYRYVGPTDDDWAFADPDVMTLIDDDSTTLREAFEKYTLPFWYLEFHGYLNEDNEAWIDIKVNGMLVYRTYIFGEYDTVNKPSIRIERMQLHCVNYGIDADGTPDASYTGSFTYPRLIK